MSEGPPRPCEDVPLAALERYWKISCSLDNFSCCGGGRSDRLDRCGDIGDVGVFTGAAVSPTEEKDEHERLFAEWM